MSYNIANLKFFIGDLVVTPGVEDRLTKKEIQEALNRHVDGDWGLVDEADKIRNDLAVEREGGTLFSRYESALDDCVFYVITEADRTVTTVLLPSEN